VADTRTGVYVMCMALANLLGPLVLGFVGAALVMLVAAGAAWWLGVEAKRTSRQSTGGGEGRCP
jgi:hypothetical protein